MKNNIKSYKDLQVWQEAVETYTQLAEKLGFAKCSELQPVQNQLEQVSRLLSGLIRSLKT